MQCRRSLLNHPPRGRSGGLPRGVGVAGEAGAVAVEGEAGGGMAGEVGEDVIRFANESGSRTLEATTK
eukprot:3315732-Prymnesium_polylepis.1